MTNVIPFDPERRLDTCLRSATPSEVQACVAMLAKSLPIMPSIQDPLAFKGIMAEFLGQYPADLLIEAVDQAIRQFKHMPSIHEMLVICEQLMEPRRKQLSEHRRKEQEKAEWQRRCRDFQARLASAVGDDAPSLNEIEHVARLTPDLMCAGMPMTWRQLAVENPRACADLCKRLAEIGRGEPPDWGKIRHLLAITEKERERKRWREVERWLRERFGDAGPLPGDVALAHSISVSRVSRAGNRISWLAALESGEPWAAQFCRLMALAERTRRAIEQGRIAWKECLAIGKLITRDEAAARSKIEEAEACEVRPQFAGQPPESFWPALWRIHKACGLEVPRSEDPDAVPAAVENLKHLSGLMAPELAKMREISTQQLREEWKQRPGRLVLRGPPEPAKEQ